MKKSIAILLTIIIVVVAVSYIILQNHYPIKYSNIIDKYSYLYHLDKSLVYSTINVESSFKCDSVSKSNAMGLMQLLPTTADDVANRLNIIKYDIFDPDTNIMFGCYYLRYLLDIYDQNIDYTIMAYNAGLGTVNSWLKNDILDNEIPYKETRDYLKKIKFNMKIYNIKL